MNIDQLNELINRGQVGFALMVIAFVLVMVIFRKDIEEISKKKSK